MSSSADNRMKPDWPAILAEHEQWLRAVLYARLRNKDDVEDAFQETFAAAISGSDKLRDLERVGPWLYQIAIRQALLFRRKQGRQQRKIEQFAQQAGSPAERDPLGWLLADERQQQVRAALAELPQRDAEILLLKYLEDWSYQQIADRIGASHSAVEARLHRARGRLRDKLRARNVAGATRR
ncbi:RNA polymerase sigma factor [Blastopirellula sp. J2-11]|uniref:RNA polymerase sigma factor n=1 Tax=Blastopirellula sp. J2-11 TaxID=2943192 RepID=UPI0021CA37CD|nr:RNA polymerase sigma factor [Blastopirellula sp. J2-11]UUO07116.1 RNA polymerase sigma factor [Blastopirellula sp. J2-11]